MSDYSLSVTRPVTVNASLSTTAADNENPLSGRSDSPAIAVPEPRSHKKNTGNIDERQYIAADVMPSDERETLLGNTCESFGRSDDDLSGTLNQLSPRVAKFILQAAARELMPNHRVKKCLRSPAYRATTIELRRGHDGVARFHGLQTCGSVWDCAVCSAKISERRAHELNGAAKRWLADGGNLLLITYTLSHTRRDTLKNVLAIVRSSIGSMKARRDYKAAKKAAGWLHDVTALEVTHGRNGFHPHFHALLFCDPIGAESVAELGRIVGGAWQAAVRGAGGSVDLSVGFDIRGGDYAADYAAKWGVVREVSNAANKKGRRGGRTPMQLLAAYALDGDAAAGRLWQEYSEAFFGREQLTWSHGAKAALGVLDASDDAIAAADDAPNYDLWAEIDLLTWRCVVMAKRDLRLELLSACEADDYAQFQKLLIDAVNQDRIRNGAAANRRP